VRRNVKRRLAREKESVEKMQRKNAHENRNLQEGLDLLLQSREKNVALVVVVVAVHLQCVDVTQIVVLAVVLVAALAVAQVVVLVQYVDVDLMSALLVVAVDVVQVKASAVVVALVIAERDTHPIAVAEALLSAPSVHGSPVAVQVAALAQFIAVDVSPLLPSRAQALATIVVALYVVVEEALAVAIVIALKKNTEKNL
jgi:hypothetical protein